MPRVPLQSGNPTLVPNFYQQRPDQDPTGQGKSVMTARSPSDITSGGRPSATDTITVGGTAHTGDVCTVTLTNGIFPSGSLVYAYTVIGGDSLATIAEAIAKLINDDSNAHNADIEADSAGAVVTISQAGPVGNFTGVTLSVTGANNTTTLAAGTATFAGGSGPIIATQNFTWATTLPQGGSGPMMTFYYGQPYDVPSNTLAAMVAGGAPIV